uniref:Uncharacterized protein n=1 Tax=Anopheles arabiensis TaxID=7173 RepID=A0A182HIK3_ANOAR
MHGKADLTNISPTRGP